MSRERESQAVEQMSTQQLMMPVDEAARRLWVSARSVWRWISAGEIKVVKLGRAVRIPASEIERIARQGVPR